MEEVGIMLYGSQFLFEVFENTNRDFLQAEQETVDASHRAFIEKYQTLDQSDIIYKGPKGDILNMPLSSLTAIEWAEILRIMEYKLGNDAVERRFNEETTTLREDFAIRSALTDMMGGATYYELWRAGGLNSFNNNQATIDENTRAFIARSQSLTTDDQVVPRMPTTRLTLDEIAFIERILTFLTGDLWVQRYDLGYPLTAEESALLAEVGNEMLGRESYNVYVT